jgi:hypothetical protein
MSGKVVYILDRLARVRLTIVVSLAVIGLACAIESEVWRFCYIVAAAIGLFALWARLFASDS